MSAHETYHEHSITFTRNDAINLILVMGFQLECTFSHYDFKSQCIPVLYSLIAHENCQFDSKSYTEKFIMWEPGFHYHGLNLFQCPLLSQ